MKRPLIVIRSSDVAVSIGGFVMSLKKKWIVFSIKMIFEIIKKYYVNLFKKNIYIYI